MYAVLFFKQTNTYFQTVITDLLHESHESHCVWHCSGSTAVEMYVKDCHYGAVCSSARKVKPIRDPIYS